MSDIYLDYNASTPIHPSVIAVMEPLLRGPWANPSALHAGGREARSIIDRAREQVAALLGALPDEVVFTSGGTEANNAALMGAWFARPDGRDHLITTTVEHPAILEPVALLERLGAMVTRVPVDRFGQVDAEAVARAITPRTFLVTVMHANNEVGTLMPIARIAEAARGAGALVHTDAAQSVGKVPTRVDELGVDLLSIAGHKAYAPKGVGALYVRRGVRLAPFMRGAGHESGRRAGTESALLTAALGAAAELAGDLSPMADVQRLRDRLWQGLRAAFGDGIVLNGHPDQRLPNTLNVSFVGQPGADVLAALDGVAASTGSACHADSIELSPVLAAMGIEPVVGMGAVRLSLGRMTTDTEIDEALTRFAAVAERGMPPHPRGIRRNGEVAP